MKYVLIALLLVFNPIWASAQKNNLFADAGISGDGLGCSITYNHKFARFFGLGVGVQGYDFSPTLTNLHQFTPSVYGDIRFYISSGKRGLFFPLLDIGIDFYKHNDKYAHSHFNDTIIANVPHDNGTYIGLGLGYFHRITKRGGGCYASLKLLANGYKYNEYNTLYQPHGIGAEVEGTFAFSVGFKF